MKKRRGFIITLGGLFGLALGGLGYGGYRHLERKKKLIQKTTGELTNFLGSRDLGELYLAAFPNESDPDRLVSVLLEGISVHETPEGIRDHMKQKIVKDYDEVRIQEMDGWILSVTELRLFALSSTV